MKENKEVYQDIKEYFKNLGYAETMFEKDLAFLNQFSNVSNVEFIVKQSNAPFIVVEVKFAKTFESIDNEKLKYDPSVRQVQTYAMNLGAPYYVITNGNNFLWFDTSEDGRPRKIEPVFYKSRKSDNVLGVTVGEALNICRELFKSDSMTYQMRSHLKD